MSDKLAILSAETGRPRSVQPAVGVGVNDGASGYGSLWLAVSRAKQVVRLDPRTGRILKRLPMPNRPSSIAIGGGAVWVGLVPGNDAPDNLVKLDPKTGQILASVAFPYGIISVTTSPGAVWVLNRRRARIQRLDPRTGQIVRTVQVGSSHGEDVVYGNGAVWIATPNDDTVYKLITATGAVIPISVGKHPRQLALAGGRVYVTDYNSSDLYTIDESSSRVVGQPVPLPVNPFSLSAAGGALWVSSQPDNQVTKLLIGRGG
jgi:streptogramin lyase